MNILVDTVDFQFAHGRKPRGNGSWAFFFKRNADVDDAFWFYGTYADAKRAAIAHAKANGKTIVYVGS